MLKILERTGGTPRSFDILKNGTNVYNGSWVFHELESNQRIEELLARDVGSIGDCDKWVHD